MRTSLFLNGVYESVLEEILKAQENDPGQVCFLQPYSGVEIKLLAEKLPSEKEPIPLYISTTTHLDKICYRADIIKWENKQKLTQGRISELNQNIEKCQPNEIKIHTVFEDGRQSVNLISIINLQKFVNRYPVEKLTKVKSGKPLKARSQAGHWAYVYEVPTWLGIEQSTTRDQFEADLAKSVQEAENIDDKKRKDRIATAPKKPEAIQVISQAFKRNPDVIVEVLKRAKGKCEYCGNDAPFIRAKDGSPYLEIHHWIPLSENGDDTVENAAAVCPNCHRELHYGILRELPKRA